MLTPQSPLYYHPIRFQQTRPFARRIAGCTARHPGLLSKSEFVMIQKKFTSEYANEIITIGRDNRPATTDKMMEEMNALGNYINFLNNGRNIFSFSAGLMEMFRHTDVGDISLAQVPLVYENFYLSFGAQPDLELYPGAFVDGAYIAVRRDEKISVYLTTVNHQCQYYGNSWIFLPEQHYYLEFDISGDKTVETSFREAFKNELAGLKESDKSFDDVIAEAQSIGIPMRHGNATERKEANIYGGFPVFIKSLNLIINSILYLGYHKREVLRRHMASAPAGLLGKIEHEEIPKKKRRHNTELELLGYYPISFCGDSVATKDNNNTMREMPAHWRRGHWRNQPFGPGRTDRMLRWIYPTIVRADKGSPENGHIYKTTTGGSEE